MVADIVNLFRPKKPGVDPAVARAQKEQAEKLRVSEARENRQKNARDRVLAANQGRRNRGTLFQKTGELGVPKQKLGT